MEELVCVNCGSVLEGVQINRYATRVEYLYTCSTCGWCKRASKRVEDDGRVTYRGTGTSTSTSA